MRRSDRRGTGGAVGRGVLLLGLALLAAWAMACSSDDTAVEEPKAATRSGEKPEAIPTDTPVPTVAREVGSCKVEPEAQCPGADFRGQDLSLIPRGESGAGGRDAADFTDANLRGANFTGANLKGVDFTGADLREAKFRDADLSSVSLFQADARGADFTGATLEQADLEEAQMEGAIFCRTMMPDGRVNSEGCP